MFTETPPRVHSPNTDGVGANGGRFGPVSAAAAAAPETRTYFGLQLRAWQQARAAGAETYPAAFSAIPTNVAAAVQRKSDRARPGTPLTSRPVGHASNVPPRRSGGQQLVAPATVAELIPEAAERAALTDGSTGFFGARLRLYQKARDQKRTSYDDPFSGVALPVSPGNKQRAVDVGGMRTSNNFSTSNGGTVYPAPPSPGKHSKAHRTPRKAPAFGHAFGYSAAASSPPAPAAAFGRSSSTAGAAGRSLSPAASPDTTLMMLLGGGASSPPPTVGAASVPDDAAAALRVSTSHSRMSASTFPVDDQGHGGGDNDPDEGFDSDEVGFSDLSSSFYDEGDAFGGAAVESDEAAAVNAASLAAAAMAGLPPAP